MTRSVMIVLLAVTCTLAGTNVAATDSNFVPTDNQTSVTRLNIPDLDLKLFAHPRQSSNSSCADQDRKEPLTETAQIWVPVATACYTFAGPTCPMVVAVSPGSSCYCFDGYGNRLAGTAY